MEYRQTSKSSLRERGGIVGQSGELTQKSVSCSHEPVQTAEDRMIVNLRKANAAPLGGLRGLTFPDADIRFAGKHVRPGALAGIADKSVSLHVAYDGMRCHRHMHHARSALRANRIGSDYIGR